MKDRTVLTIERDKLLKKMKNLEELVRLQEMTKVSLKKTTKSRKREEVKDEEYKTKIFSAEETRQKPQARKENTNNQEEQEENKKRNEAIHSKYCSEVQENDLSSPSSFPSSLLKKIKQRRTKHAKKRSANDRKVERTKNKN